MRKGLGRSHAAEKKSSSDITKHIYIFDFQNPAVPHGRVVNHTTRVPQRGTTFLYIYRCPYHTAGIQQFSRFQLKTRLILTPNSKLTLKHSHVLCMHSPHIAPIPGTDPGHNNTILISLTHPNDPHDDDEQEGQSTAEPAEDPCPGFIYISVRNDKPRLSLLLLLLLWWRWRHEAVIIGTVGWHLGRHLVPRVATDGHLIGSSTS